MFSNASRSSSVNSKTSSKSGRIVLNYRLVKLIGEGKSSRVKLG